MVDITSICNQALAAIGTRTSIASIGEASNEARQCLLQYDSTRRFVLRSAHWGFARSYTQLALEKARFGTPEAPPNQPPATSVWNPQWEPPPPWVYSYRLPATILAIRYLLPNSPSEQPIIPFFGTQGISQYPAAGSGPMPKFEIANSGSLGVTTDPNTMQKKVILTNQAQAIACVTADIQDPEMFDESFTRALVQGLACNIVVTLTGDLKLFDALVKTANTFISDARVKNANEALNVNDVMPDWLRVRGVGPTAGTGPWIPEYGPLFGGSI